MNIFNSSVFCPINQGFSHGDRLLAVATWMSL